MGLAMAIQQLPLGVDQVGGATLGDVVIHRHIRAPMAEHLAHIAQPQRGQFKGALKVPPTGTGEQGTGERR